jgi:hypothetical protein
LCAIFPFTNNGEIGFIVCCKSSIDQIMAT